MDVTLFIEPEAAEWPFWATTLIVLGAAAVAVGIVLLVAKLTRFSLGEYKMIVLAAPLLVGMLALIVSHSFEREAHDSVYYGHATEALVDAADSAYSIQLTPEHAETLIHSVGQEPVEGSVERFESVEVMNPTTDAPATIQLAWFGDEWVLIDGDGDELPSAGTSWE